jgi:septal ring factor EnvC (AmiA/AmiB activator)
MMYLRLLPLVVVMMLAGGCTNHKLVDCQNQNQKLQADLTKVQQNLKDETAKHTADVDKLNADVDKLNAESKEIQTQAMQSMTTMLKKDQDLQDKMKAKIAELEAQVKTQAEQITKLSGSLTEMEKKTPAAPGAK